MKAASYSILLFKKIRTVFIGLILMVLAGNTDAQSLFSASVDPVTGFIIIKWNNDTGTSTITYNIYIFKSGESPIKVDSSVLATLNNIDTIRVDGRLGRYNVKVEKVLAASPSTQNTFIIFSSIFLQVTPRNSNIFGVNAIAELSWNPVDPNLPGEFIITRKGLAGWIDIDTIPSKDGETSYMYSDTIASPFCGSQFITYEIRFIPKGNTSYTSISNQVTSGPFSDLTEPANVINDTISIYNNPNSPYHSKPIIGWSPSPSNDILGYKILRKDPSAPVPSYDSIATVPYGTNFYIDTEPTLNACNKKYAYAVQSIDKCGKTSSGTFISETIDKQTILLTVPPINSCERKAYLSWNKYNGMPHGLGGYKIFRRVDIGPNILEINIHDTTKTTYEDSFNFQSGHNYSYFIEAYSRDSLYTSSSCSPSTVFTGPDIPEVVYITKASVEENSFIRISYYSSPIKTIKELIIERSIDDTLNFQPINSLLPSYTGGFVADTSHFDDKNVEVGGHSYYYRLVAIDECGLRTRSSNIARSILLKCSQLETENFVEWNIYEKWLNGVESYYGFRTEGGEPIDGEFLFAKAGVYTYSDIYSNAINATAPDLTQTICYWVVAHESPGNPYLTNVTSRSNTCCLIPLHTLFMPNAFHPGTSNNYLFRPVWTFVDKTNFIMNIFNRWGQQLAEVTDIDKGWDGYSKGLLVPAGLYAYILSYQDFRGVTFTKRGTVTVVR